MINRILQNTMSFGMTYNRYSASIVYEPHQGNTLYLPFTISVRELVERVKSRKPNIDVLCTEWVRWQFSPQNPSTSTVLKYTSCFDIKFKVRRRQMRIEHADSKYVFVYYLYLK